MRTDRWKNIAYGIELFELLSILGQKNPERYRSILKAMAEDTACLFSDGPVRSSGKRVECGLDRVWLHEYRGPAETELLDLPAARNAIVLTAHIHASIRSGYKSAVGTIMQEKALKLPLRKDFQGKITHLSRYYPGAGFSMLHVTDEGGLIDLCFGSIQETVKILKVI